MRRLSYVISLGAFFFLMVMYDFYAAFLGFAALLLAPVPSLLLSFWAKKHLSVSLALPPRAVRGEETAVTVTLQGPCLSFLPGLSLAAEGLTAEGARKRHSLSFSLPFCPAHCGRQALPAMTLSFSDLFGLTGYKKEFSGEEITALPRMMGHAERGQASLSRLLAAQEPERFGAAPYQTGDSVRLINWKVTARKDELYVRDTWPGEESSLLLAASLPAEGHERDTVGDALLTVGKLLLTAGKTFTFLWADDKHHAHTEKIRTGEDWERSLLLFLKDGSARSPFLGGSTLPADLPVLFLTGEADPVLPPHRPLYVWNADEKGKGALAGRAAIAAALGGEA